MKCTQLISFTCFKSLFHFRRHQSPNIHYFQGENWKDGFANGLLNSLCILPLLSYGATAPLAAFPPGQAEEKVRMGWEELPVGRRRLQGNNTEPEDNVLLELQIAGALLARRAAPDRTPSERGLLQYAYPVLIVRPHPAGHPDYPRMGSFFDVQGGGGVFPKSPSASTAAEAAEMLARAGLPPEYLEAVRSQSVAAAVKAITDLQVTLKPSCFSLHVITLQPSAASVPCLCLVLRYIT